MAQLPSLEPFECDGDSTSVGLRWEKWKRALSMYLIAANVTDAERKRATLLHMGGLTLKEIYYNIPGAHAQLEWENDIFKIALD